MECLSKWRTNQSNLLWFDTTDSAGWIFEGALSLAKAYYKNQILLDRSLYLKPMYGRRAPSHFYHSHAGAIDENGDDQPQVQDASILEKLKVSWNSGLANYSVHGPRLLGAYSLFPWRGLLKWPAQFGDPSGPRPNDVSCRFGVSYNRATVSYQRRAINRLMKDSVPTNKVRRTAYVRELHTSKIVVSPFGLGEITLKDFEVFLAGSLLLKPDMSHMETWPNLFIDGKTIKTFDWNLENLEDQIETLIEEEELRIGIAYDAQTRYRACINEDSGETAFMERLLPIIEDGLA